MVIFGPTVETTMESPNMFFFPSFFKKIADLKLQTLHHNFTTFVAPIETTQELNKKKIRNPD